MIVVPDNDKSAVRKFRHRRIVLTAALVGRVDQELVDLDYRRIDVGATILGRVDLGKDIGAVAATRPRTTAVVPPGDDETVTVRRH